MRTTKQIGDKGEAATCEYLRRHKFKIISRNWRTRYCEIDIIAEKQKRIYFVEVKTRKNTNQGDGFAYITAKKLQQMSFAAELWVNEQQWSGEYQLAAASVVNDKVTFIDSL